MEELTVKKEECMATIENPGWNKAENHKGLKSAHKNIEQFSPILKLMTEGLSNLTKTNFLKWMIF